MRRQLRRQSSRMNALSDRLPPIPWSPAPVEGAGAVTEALMVLLKVSLPCPSPASVRELRLPSQPIYSDGGNTALSCGNVSGSSYHRRDSAIFGHSASNKG